MFDIYYQSWPFQGRMSGPRKVIENLIRSLEDNKIKYSVNKETFTNNIFLHWYATNVDLYATLGRKETSLIGPQIWPFSPEFNQLNVYGKIIVPSQWVGNLFQRSFGVERFLVWPVAVYAPLITDDISNDCLIYFKNRSVDDLAAVKDMLDKRRLTYIQLEYGHYTQEDFARALSSVRFCVIIDSTESQGIAVQEMMACNKPLFVWNTPVWNHMGEDYAIEASSVPYWSEECGEIFSDAGELHGTFERFCSNLTHYASKAFFDSHLSPEKSVNILLEHFSVPCPTMLRDATARHIDRALEREIPDRPLKPAAPRPLMSLPDPILTLDRLVLNSLWHPGKPLKLHLGCGEQHLEGYVNIDHPPSEHSVQSQGAADIFADITRLSFPFQSVDEIRLHHVLEHFDRATALALLVNWHRWLNQGGLLVIETPDLNASLSLLLSDQQNYQQKQAALRHLFGSHEADWAVHWDGWYEEKFRRVLGAMGFDGLEFEHGQWQMTRNITVRARKCRELSPSELRLAAEAILRNSLIDESESEQRMLQVWMKKFDGLAQDPVMPRRDHQTALHELKAAAVQHSMGHVSSSLLLDVVIPAAAKDAETLPYVVEGLRRNLRHPIGTIFVIGESDAKLQEVVREAGACFVDENGVLPLRRTDLKYSVNGTDRSGWLFQKFLKFAGATLSDKTHVLVIDSDTVLIRPQVFEVGGKLVLLHADEHHEIYFQVCENLLGYPRATELSCVSHMALYDLARLGALKAHIEKRFQCPWFEAIIRNTKMDDASGCSDYELYGQWCLSQYPLETTCEYFFNTHCGREGLCPVVELERRYGATYRSLSFHSYVPRECLPPLQAPLVSIFMPVYNREKYLPATLDSLLAQSFTNFEIIIADDGSTDGTLELARGYAGRDARVKVLSLHHQGEVVARNEAVAHADPGAKYLMNHDSDDISLPDKLFKLVTFLESHPGTAIAGCFAEYFDDEGRTLGNPPIEHEPTRIRATFGQINSMINSAALIRREVFEKIGCFREEFRRAEDYDFFARALLAGFELANIPEVLHRTRLHSASVGSIHSPYVQDLAEIIRTDYREGRVPVAQPRPAIQSASITKHDKESLSILHTVEFYPPHTGGAEFVVQQLSERLARRGHRIVVATSHLDDRNFRELNGVTVSSFAVQGKLAEGITGEAARYQQFLREHDADVMMNYAAQQWATDLAFDVVAETQGRRVNIIAPCGYSALADHQTLRWPSFREYFEHQLPEVLPLYDAAVYHSGIYQDFEYGRALNLQNGVIIPNGTDEEEFTRPVAVSFREKYKITTRFIGLCVANFYADKGQDQVIECVRQMNRPDFTMVFIGKEGGQCDALRQQATGLDVRLLINIPREDTVAAFRSADLFLFASRIEASPLVIIEAKAAGLPFVSTDCGNVREWKGGIVCAPENMATEALRLLNDDGVRKHLGHEGQQEWKEKLTWEAVTDQWEQLYLRLHRERQRSAQTGGAVSRNDLVEHQRIFCQMHPLQKLPDPKKQYSQLMKENAKLLKKCRLLEKQVESARQWQSRSWFKRAFHKWRPAKASSGKMKQKATGLPEEGNQA